MISRLHFLYIAVSLGVGFFPCAPASAEGKPGGYNVLFLMTDEHNPAVLGCSGDKLVQTPALDSLAATGVRFTAAYCQNPICVPSRVSLVSGRMPSNIGVRGNGASPKYEGITTLADAFVQGGYQAAWLGKTHWGDPRFQKSGKRDMGENGRGENGNRLPQESSISPWPVERNPEHLITNEAIEFLEKHKDGRFFLGVSFSKPHFPFTIQEKYYDLYRGKVSPPRAAPELINELPAISQKERARYRLAEATEEDVLRTKAIYYGMVTYVDEEFGRILNKLDELGLRENTIIVYTADHGEMLGDRGLWYKNSFLDGSVRVPFLWSFPKELPQGKVVSAPAMNLDIFPTLCDLAGLPKPEGLEGHSLFPLMGGQEDGKERYALAENYRGAFSGRMIRTDKWKYFTYTTGEEFLYDMERDPGEETNLISDPGLRQTADELRQRALEGWVDKDSKHRPPPGNPS